MRIKLDYFKYSFTTLTRRRLRSWLTMIGIFIGIAAVVALISLGQGLRSAITEQFEELGSDKIFIQPKGGFGVPGTSAVPNPLTTDDMKTIRNTRGIKQVASFLSGVGKIEFKDEIVYSFIAGFPLSGEEKIIIEQAINYDVEFGRNLRKGDKFKAVIGTDLKHKDIFSKRVNVGDKININNYEFKVVGVWESIGNPSDDSSITIPFDTFVEIYDKGDEVDMIFAQVGPGEDVDSVAEGVEKKLRKDRDLELGEEDFTVSTPTELLETFNVVIDIVQIILVGIAAISLFVGGIGIMNTMYTSVLERTKEIGVMKALGARNADVAWLFLIESGMLGLAGGVIGVILGLSFAKITEYAIVNFYGITILKIELNIMLVVGALLFSFVVGALSGLLPAIQGSRLKPVDALRYE